MTDDENMAAALALDAQHGTRYAEQLRDRSAPVKTETGSPRPAKVTDRHRTLASAWVQSELARGRPPSLDDCPEDAYAQALADQEAAIAYALRTVCAESGTPGACLSIVELAEWVESGEWTDDR